MRLYMGEDLSGGIIWGVGGREREDNLCLKQGIEGGLGILPHKI